jgi:hypothetical protein
MSKPALIFFFTARVHTTKYTVKILAANTYCKYFLKIAEVTHFFLYAEPLVPEVCTTLLTAVPRPRELDLGNDRTSLYSRI